MSGRRKPVKRVPAASGQLGGGFVFPASNAQSSSQAASPGGNNNAVNNATNNTKKAFCGTCREALNLINPHRQRCGHDATFVNEPKSMFVCPLSQDVFLYDACIRTPCEHNFDSPDLQRALAVSPTCPLCKTPVQFDQCKESLFLKQMIGDLEIKCIYQDKGCGWEGAMERMKHHILNECAHALLPCPQGCPFRGVRGEIAGHICLNAEQAKASERVALNVGGMRFDTTSATLKACENSLFWLMFTSGKKPHADEDGAVFIDRDGTHFRLILNWLRAYPNGKLPKLTSFTTLEELLAEATYYKLPKLVEEVEAKMFTCPEGDVKFIRLPHKHDIKVCSAMNWEYQEKPPQDRIDISREHWEIVISLISQMRNIGFKPFFYDYYDVSNKSSRQETCSSGIRMSAFYIEKYHVNWILFKKLNLYHIDNHK